MTGADRPRQMRTRTTLAVAEFFRRSDNCLVSHSTIPAAGSTGPADAVPNLGKPRHPKEEH